MEGDEDVRMGRERRMKMCGRALQCAEDNDVWKGMEVSTGMTVSEGGRE